MYTELSHTALSNKRIAVIEAHADDAAAMLSGAVEQADLSGSTIYGITTTNGQWTDKRQGLTDVVRGRRAEAERGWRAMGVPFVRQAHLPIEDGELSRPSNVLRLGSYLARFALAREIDTFVTLGEYGGDSHPDHIASHHAALAAQHQLRTHHNRPITVLGLDEGGEVTIPVNPVSKIRQLGNYASQFEIMPAVRAPRSWSVIGGHAVSLASRSQLETYEREIFDAERFTVFGDKF